MKQDGIWEKKGKGVTLPEETSPKDSSLHIAAGSKGFLLQLFTRQNGNRESIALFPGHAEILQDVSLVAVSCFFALLDIGHTRPTAHSLAGTGTLEEARKRQQIAA